MADASDELHRLYARRAVAEAECRAADQSVVHGDRTAVMGAERLAGELNFLDLRIARLEATNEPSD